MRGEVMKEPWLIVQKIDSPSVALEVMPVTADTLLEEGLAVGKRVQMEFKESERAYKIVHILSEDISDRMTVVQDALDKCPDGDNLAIEHRMLLDEIVNETVEFVRAYPNSL